MRSLVFLLLLFLIGCTGRRSDSWSMVPTTNNPHLIIDSNKGSASKAFDY